MSQQAISHDPGWLNAGAVFSVAKAAANRRIAQRRRSARYPNDALVAIVFSTAALEAFINETANLALQRFRYLPRDRIVDEHPTVEQFGNECERIERDRERKSLQAKFRAASKLFTGAPYAEGRRPYQPFAQLIDLRNEIMHARADDFPAIRFHGEGLLADPPPVARKLTGVKLGVPKKGGMGSYVQWLDSPDVARWACNAASAMVQSVLGMVPAPVRPPDPRDFDPEAPASWALRDALREFYGAAFTPIPTRVADSNHR
jgi:hypothetical protein